jgi:hypothetical protein
MNFCTLRHMIILNEKHLYDVLHEYIFDYYNVSRTHMRLCRNAISRVCDLA